MGAISDSKNIAFDGWIDIHADYAISKKAEVSWRVCVSLMEESRLVNGLATGMQRGLVLQHISTPGHF